ncbi:MAG: hypothetical protein NXH71_02690 [Erythrobacteraceae bacterium]|jgi:hypothetical protein|nr:hypothetical protein [Erythrobacteraceae bacterium]
MPHGKRFDGGPNTEAAEKRYQLYKLAFARYNSAMEDGYFIEAICICESIIGDRMEARLQLLRRDKQEPTHSQNLDRLCSLLGKAEAQSETEMHELYAAIKEWSGRRNASTHQFVKLAEDNHHMDGAQRIANDKQVAEDGMALVDRIKKLVKAKNKWSAAEA